MSKDLKRYEQMMSKHMEGQYRQQIQREVHDPRMQQQFLRPAVQCQACGTPMSIDPVTGQSREITVWERKWSIHRVCAENVQNQLDRATGVLTERNQK